MAKLLREGDERAIARHLVMLHRLRRGNDGSVTHRFVGAIAHDFLGFAQYAVHSFAGDGLGLKPVHFKNLFEALDLTLGFLEVILERGLQLRIRRLLDHARQVFDDLAFGVIDVLQRVDEQIIQRPDGLAWHGHEFCPSPCLFALTKPLACFGDGNAGFAGGSCVVSRF